MIWKPKVTVAAVVQRDGKFLLVEEETEAGLAFNQPAGHLEDGEALIDAGVRETLEVTDRAYIMHQGVILTQGSAQQLIDDPIVRETYLGENFYFQKTR